MKTAGIINMQEQMVETSVWEKMGRISDLNSCKLCGKRKETVKHFLARSKILTVVYYRAPWRTFKPKLKKI